MKYASRILFAGLICAGLAITTSDAGEKKNSATTSINRDTLRHKQILKAAKKGGIDVVFIGDLTTQEWKGQKAWKEHFEPLKAANFGHYGDQTGHVLWRLTEGDELNGISPKVAVLLIGRSNIGGVSTNPGESTAVEIAEGIKLIVKTIHMKSPTTKVLLLAVLPRGEAPNSTAHQKLSEINKIIAKLDDQGKTVTFLDISAKFLDKEGNVLKTVMGDVPHLSPTGYEVFAEAIAPTLKAMLK